MYTEYVLKARESQGVVAHAYSCCPQGAKEGWLALAAKQVWWNPEKGRKEEEKEGNKTNPILR